MQVVFIHEVVFVVVGMASYLTIEYEGESRPGIFLDPERLANPLWPLQFSQSKKSYVETSDEEMEWFMCGNPFGDIDSFILCTLKP